MRWPPQIGRWGVRGALGAGGTAEVLLGVDGDREVALKRPVAERVDDPAMIALIRAEAAVLSQIRHENVVGFVELIDGEPPTLVLERMRGLPLAEVPPAVLDEAMRLEIVVQAAAALAAVHAAADARGPLAIVHRDVSPENLFVCEDGVVRLFDFNVAVSRDHAPVHGALQGRVAYMAPEQARSEAVTSSADVFALGVVAWELFTGERLFWKNGVPATLRALIEEPIPRLSERRAIQPSLDALVARMLDRAPAARPTAAEVVAEARTVLTEASPTGVVSDVRARLGGVVVR